MKTLIFATLLGLCNGFMMQPLLGKGFGQRGSRLVNAIKQNFPLKTGKLTSATREKPIKGLKLGTLSLLVALNILGHSYHVQAVDEQQHSTQQAPDASRGKSDSLIAPLPLTEALDRIIELGFIDLGSPDFGFLDQDMDLGSPDFGFLDQDMDLGSPDFGFLDFNHESPLSSLHLAAMSGNYDQVRNLLTQTPEMINAQDEDGNTPLHLLAQGRIKFVADIILFDSGDTLDRIYDIEMAQFLLANGAARSLGIKNHKGERPYDIVARHEDLNPVAGMQAVLVKAMYGLYGEDEAGLTALDYALYYREHTLDKSLAQQLIAEGANFQSLRAHNPLDVAAQLADREGFLALARENGGIAALVKEKGDYYLQLAVDNINMPVVELLLDHGGNPNATDEMGRTPIHSAVLAEDTEALAILLDRGGNPNATDKMGRTPLHLIAQHPSIEVEPTLELLLEHGINFMKKDNEGLTPLDYAEETLASLKAQGAVTTEIERAEKTFRTFRLLTNLSTALEGGLY